MKKLFIVVLTLGVMLWAKGDFIDEQSVKKHFLIAKSTKNYTEAKAFASKLSTQTHIKLNLREMHYNKALGLTQSQKVCEENSFEYPCYWSRGRYDDGVYISVEYSDAYLGFSKGYYIVIVASGEYAKRTLRSIKPFVKDAYVKSTKIYMGCMH